jgi:hypothetical protein
MRTGEMRGGQPVFVLTKKGKEEAEKDGLEHNPLQSRN